VGDVLDPDPAPVGGHRAVLAPVVFAPIHGLAARGHGGLAVFGVDEAGPEARLLQPAPQRDAQELLRGLAHEGEPERLRVGLPHDAADAVHQLVEAGLDGADLVPGVGGRLELARVVRVEPLRLERVRVRLLRGADGRARDRRHRDRGDREQGETGVRGPAAGQVPAEGEEQRGDGGQGRAGPRPTRGRARRAGRGDGDHLKKV